MITSFTVGHAIVLRNHVMQILLVMRMMRSFKSERRVGHFGDVVVGGGVSV